MRVRNLEIAAAAGTPVALLARVAVLGAAATVPVLGVSALALSPHLIEPFPLPGRAFSPFRLTRAGRRELRLGVLALAARRALPELRQESLPW